MPFKYDETGALVLGDLDGQKLPIYVAADGRESPFDPDGAITKIARLNGESKTHREAKETAETRLKQFEGIEDPEEARTAVSQMRSMKGKNLVDLGEVERVRNEAVSALEAKYGPIAAEVETLRGALSAERIDGAFARSKFIADKVAVPADMVRASFGHHFKLEDGKAVAYTTDGQKIFSEATPGAAADFEEAIQILVNKSPYAASILKGSGASGGGSVASIHVKAGPRTMSRAAFERLTPAERAATARDRNIVLTD